MPHIHVTDFEGHLFSVTLVDRGDPSSQRWGVEVRILDAEGNLLNADSVTLGGEFTSMEAAKSAGNDRARQLIADRAKKAG
jgi:hypothetical protein